MVANEGQLSLDPRAIHGKGRPPLSEDVFLVGPSFRLAFEMIYVHVRN